MCALIHAHANILYLFDRVLTLMSAPDDLHNLHRRRTGTGPFLNGLLPSRLPGMKVRRSPSVPSDLPELLLRALVNANKLCSRKSNIFSHMRCLKQHVDRFSVNLFVYQGHTGQYNITCLLLCFYSRSYASSSRLL